jgi:hypothetical protein
MLKIAKKKDFLPVSFSGLRMTAGWAAILIILLLFTAVSGCKKDEDTEGPSISIETPNENQLFNVFDVVHIKATATDENKLTEVNVSLVDQNYNQKHSIEQIAVSSPSTSFEHDYWLNNIHLPSGIYYIMVAASDGVNISKSYRRIVLNEIPTTVRRFLVCTSTGSSSTNVSVIDSTFSSLSPYTSFSGDFLGSGLSSYNQRFFSSGSFTGALNSYNLVNNTPGYTVAAVPSINPYFTGFYNTEQTTYVAKYDGSIKGYNYGGGNIYSNASSDGYYTKQFCFVNGFLIAEQKYRTSSSKILVSHQPSGAALHQTALAQDVVALVEKNEDNVFLFGNIAGQGVIQLYDIPGNGLWNPYPGSLPTGSILSAVRINEDTYLIGMSNGNIYKYQYTSSGLTLFLPGFNAKKLILDPIQNILYVVESNLISRFAYPSMSPLSPMASAEPVLDFNILYNK